MGKALRCGGVVLGEIRVDQVDNKLGWIGVQRHLLVIMLVLVVFATQQDVDLPHIPAPRTTP